GGPSLNKTHRFSKDLSTSDMKKTYAASPSSTYHLGFPVPSAPRELFAWSPDMLGADIEGLVEVNTWAPYPESAIDYPGPTAWITLPLLRYALSRGEPLAPIR